MYRLENVSKEFSTKIYQFLQLNDLLNYLHKFFIKIFDFEWVDIYLYRGGGSDELEIIQPFRFKKSVLSDNIVIKILLNTFYLKERHVFRDELELALPDQTTVSGSKVIEKQYALWEILEKFSITGLINLCSKSDLGLVVILGKREQYSLNNDEIKVLYNIENLLGLAFSRSLLYQQVSDFNATLQKEVEKATTRLKRQLKRVQELRARERDMLDIMGHELRTPLSIIKMTVDILDHKAKNTPEEFDAKGYLQYAERVKGALEREIRLLEKMLSSAKIDAKRMHVEMQRVDIVTVINDSILAMRRKADEKGLQLRAYLGAFTEAWVLADKVRINEVVDNLINNAVKYTESGFVSVFLEKREGKRRSKYVIRVVDSGIGIPKGGLSRLGKKFYRVKQHIDDVRSIVRPGGSGLGLYVTFNLIKLMGGAYKVISKIADNDNIYCISSRAKGVSKCSEYRKEFIHGHGSIFIVELKAWDRDKDSNDKDRDKELNVFKRKKK